MYNHTRSGSGNGGGGGNGNNTGSGYDPMFYDTTPPSIRLGDTKTLTITGEFFTPDMTVTSTDATITNFTFISTESITCDIEGTAVLTATITLTTPVGTVDFTYLVDVASQWVDLRIGGDAYTETHKSGTTVTQTTEGLQQSGSLWGNWLKITSEIWQRSVPADVGIIMKMANSTLMFGIMGSLQNESSGSQYYQAELYCYFSSGNTSSFYGTNSSHGGVSGAIAVVSSAGYPYIKVKFSNNGEAGHTVYFYGLSDLNDFDDESHLLGQRTVPANMTAASPQLYLCATMGNTSQRMVAVNTGM